MYPHTIHWFYKGTLWNALNWQFSSCNCGFHHQICLFRLFIWFLFFFGIQVWSTGPFMMDIYLVKSELVWIAHCWVWVFWVTLEVDKSVLELMSLWVRSFVLGIAKDSCRSNSAHHPLPLFNTLDSFPRTQMPIYFNKFFKRGKKKAIFTNKRQHLLKMF